MSRLDADTLLEAVRAMRAAQYVWFVGKRRPEQLEDMKKAERRVDMLVKEFDARVAL